MRSSFSLATSLADEHQPQQPLSRYFAIDTWSCNSRYGVSGFSTLKFFPKNNKVGEEYDVGKDSDDFAIIAEALDALVKEFFSPPIEEKKVELKKLYGKINVKGAKSCLDKGPVYSKNEIQSLECILAKSSASDIINLTIVLARGSIISPCVFEATNSNKWHQELVLNTLKWSPPRMEGPNGVFILTPETQWTNDDRIISNFNSRALNAIFVSVDVSCFKMMCNCTTAYQAWNILQEHCEGSTSLLHTLLERFNMKISAIEEAHNVSNMSLSEASVTSTSDVQLDVENIQEINEDESLSVALLTKKFNSLVRSLKKGSPNLKPRRLFNSPSSTSSGSTKSSKSPDDSEKDIDSIQCRECLGFGHYTNECPIVHMK
ncbi:hypothetical protein C2S51_016266 [Perilla frutescens var. frutescens]|nr:hypothetical protein C2S51_016266 [Perilla frutescens var. frutescens]